MKKVVRVFDLTATPCLELVVSPLRRWGAVPPEPSVLNMCPSGDPCTVDALQVAPFMAVRKHLRKWTWSLAMCPGAWH